MKNKRCRWFVWTALIVGSAFLWAISATENDNFENGTVQNWRNGQNTNAVSNVAHGGPGGAGDNFLRVISMGGGGPTSRMAVKNNTQWTGDYNAVGPAFTVQVELANLGGVPLSIRLGVGNTIHRYISTTPFNLPADGVWRTATFSIVNADMTSVGGTQTLAQVLDSVTEMRFISASSASWQGDSIFATLGLDNIRVASVPVELMELSVE